MELNEKQLSQLKSIELDILKTFIEICEKLNLKYYLLGGTLLGAVRHKGFIPWDDDIDVGMPRSDYEKFIKLAQDHFPKNYFLQTCYTDDEFPANFAKIRKSDTAFIESSAAHLKMNHGVYIDVFPLDYYPEKNTLSFNIKAKFLSLRIDDALKLNNEYNPKVRIIKAIARILFPSWKKAVIKRDRLYRSIKKGRKLANHGGAWGEKEIVPIEWYGEGVLAQFENLKVRMPSEFDKWLTQVYGDYMQLPPLEKRKAHHYVDVVDLEKSYTVYTESEK